MQFDLVFEGGGAKGAVFVGALQELEAQGHTHGRLLGTSAGAITAALRAAGYSATEMLAAVSEKVEGHSAFANFLSQPASFDKVTIQASATRSFLRQVNLPLLPGQIEEAFDDALATQLMTQPSLCQVFSFLERGGIYSAEFFLRWLRQKLDEGTHRGQPRRFSALTMAEFHAATGNNLSLIAADTSAQEMLVLNHMTAPDLPVVWAVRMSMSVPFLWEEVIWDKSWGLYRQRSLAGHAIVDGGVLSNFPIELFLSTLKTVTEVMGPVTSERVLGLLIDEDQAVPGAVAAPLSPRAELLLNLNITHRLVNFLNTMLSSRDKRVMESFAHLVVRLPAQGYGTVEFDMTDERRDLLVAAGRAAMVKYLAAADPGQVSFGISDDATQAADAMAVKLLWGEQA